MERQIGVGKISLIAIALVVVLALLLFRPISLVFAGKIELSSTFNLFGLKGHYYGLLMFFALALGYLVARTLGKLERVELDKYLFSIFLGFIWALIGARIGYVIFKLDQYHSFWQMVAIWEGGLSIHGALVATAIYLFWWTRKFKFNFWQFADILTPGIALGTAIARWGNFFNQEAYGLPTSFPWKMFISPENRFFKYAMEKFYHPTFLYESALDFFLFLLLLQIFSRDYQKGTTALLYVAGYSLIRFFVEFLRIDSEKWAMLSIAQWVSLGLIILVVVIFVRRRAYGQQ